MQVLFFNVSLLIKGEARRGGTKARARDKYSLYYLSKRETGNAYKGIQQHNIYKQLHAPDTGLVGL